MSNFYFHIAAFCCCCCNGTESYSERSWVLWFL